MVDTIKDAVKALLVAAIVVVCVIWPLVTSAPVPEQETLTAVAKELAELVARLATAVIALVVYIKSLIRKDEIEVEYYRLAMQREVADLEHAASLAAIKRGQLPGGGIQKQ